MNKILLVVDLQEAFRKEPAYSICQDFIKEHRKDYIRIIKTVFYNPKEKGNRNYKRFLGYTDECMTTDEISTATLDKDTIIKYGTYGIRGDISDMGSGIYLPTKVSYDVIGCELDACIMAIAFQLFDGGLDFHILTDYCYTANNELRDAAILLMRRNFGKAVI